MCHHKATIFYQDASYTLQYVENSSANTLKMLIYVQKFNISQKLTNSCMFFFYEL